MKLLVDAPGYWPSEEQARKKAWLYLASAKRFGVEPQLYGIGCQAYPGETEMRLNGQIEYLKQHASEYTHVLFSDAWDVLFTAALTNIVHQYEEFGSPHCLMSGSIQNLNAHPQNMYDSYFDMARPYPYLGIAMYIAEIPFIIDSFSRMDRSKTHDHTPSYMQGWIEGWFDPAIDSNCDVFQDKENNCIVKDGHLFNTLTGTYPSMLHVSGDYMDPEIGRDPRIIPWAQKLGII